MWKLVKYELRGRRLVSTIGLISMAALTLYLAVRLMELPPYTQGQPDTLVSGAPIIMAWCWILFYLVVTVVNILTYTQDLYGDTGYLVFSLPLRGAAILGSRIVLLVLDTLMTLLGGMASVIILTLLTPGLGQQVAPHVGRFLLTGDFWVMCLGVLTVIVSVMLIMFFGVTFGKTLPSAKKHMSSIVSAILIIAVLLASARAGIALNQLFAGWRITLEPWSNLAVLAGPHAEMEFPLGFPLLFLALGVVSFLRTSWLMDHRLNF